jgi:hypothetical protein
MPNDILYTKLYLIPKIKNKYIRPYPFSYEFAMQCLQYGCQSEECGTLDNSNLPKLFGILLKFFNFNKNIYKFDDQFLKKHKLDGYLMLPMTNENIVAPSEFKTLF